MTDNKASSDVENQTKQAAELGVAKEDNETSSENTPPPSPASDEVKEKKAANKSEPVNVTATPNRFFSMVWVIVVLLVCGLLAYGAYFSYQQLRDQKAATTRLALTIDSMNQNLQNMGKVQAEQSSQFEQALGSLNKRIDASELRLQAQQKRILSLSTTSRDDWLLAEAEYLLKLANQRVLVERKADSAIALFEQADTILRDLGDPDLFPLREALKRDLVALKLAKKIDVEGIYLELAALASTVDSIPLVPEAFNYEVEGGELDVGSVANQGTEQNSLQRFFQSFKRYVRIINHDEKPAAILPPDATAYLHLNLRMMIERAQLALLREQAHIYVSSLQEAERWVSRYFPSSQAADQYQQTLSQLAKKSIVHSLPDVSDSLDLLHSYISDLHRLKPSGTAPVQLKNPQSNSLSKPTNPAKHATAAPAQVDANEVQEAL